LTRGAPDAAFERSPAAGIFGLTAISNAANLSIFSSGPATFGGRDCAAPSGERSRVFNEKR
jgi:hypothetical protein